MMTLRTIRIRGARSSDVNPGDRAFGFGVATLAVLGVVLLATIVVLLLRDAWPAIERFGLSFVTTTTWNPVRERFGALAFIYGTVVTSIIALLLATPIGVGAAVYLAEEAPPWLAGPVGFLIELLAAIPSIVYGLWGFFVLVPVFRGTVEPFLKAVFGGVPIIGGLFAGPAIGKDILVGGVILAIMVLPTITSISREIIRVVPDTQREGMLALGATRWEMIRGAVLPYARAGIVGAVLLGLARALGETMAVTMVIGNSSKNITGSLLTPGYTMASAIANQFNEADTEIYFSAVVLVALVLMIVAALANLGARLLIWSFSRGPQEVRG